MTDTLMIRGYVGNDPQSTTTAGGTPVLNFRVATSQRRFDARTGTWIDMGTNWYSVSAYRQLAENAGASLRKGDAVIVSGRLKLREWESASGQKGASFDLDADAIGHDMKWGTSNYMKTRRQTAPEQSPSADAPAAQEQGGDPSTGGSGEDAAPFDAETVPADPWSQGLLDGQTGEVLGDGTGIDEDEQESDAA